MNDVMKSNKGQSLVLFIVFIPFIIIIGTFVIDLGYAKYNDNKLNNINKIVLKYGLEHITENPNDEMIKLIFQNESDIDDYKIDIDTENNTIILKLNKSSKGLFGSIAGKNIYHEESIYKGYIEDEKYVIERVDKNEK